MYTVFTRTWWTENSDYPDGLEPCAGRKQTLQNGVESEREAKLIAQEWNRTHKPGRLSKKAEFMEVV